MENNYHGEHIIKFMIKRKENKLTLYRLKMCGSVLRKM